MYLIVIVIIVALVVLLLAALFADTQAGTTAPAQRALYDAPRPTSLPQSQAAVPAQLTVPGTAAEWAAPAAPGSASQDDDFVPVATEAASAILTPADIKDIERNFEPVSPELTGFATGQVTDSDTDPNALCWVTGQSVAACQCDDCKELRRRREDG